MQQAGSDRSLQGVGAMGKEDKQDGGRKREGCPSSEPTDIPAPHQPYRKSNLAAGRTRQKLAKRDQIGENGFVDPATPDYKFVSEIAYVGNRPAKAAHAEFGESEQHLPAANQIDHFFG